MFTDIVNIKEAQEQVKRQQAAEVRRRIEEVRIARLRMAAVREPLLQQRGARGDDEKRQPDREKKHQQQTRDRIAFTVVQQAAVQGKPQVEERATRWSSQQGGLP